MRLDFFLNKSKEKGYQKAYDMCNDLKELVVEYLFLKEVDSCSLRNSIFNLEDSYKNFLVKEVDIQYLKINLVSKAIRTTCIKSSYKGNNYSNIEIDLKNKKIKLPKSGFVSIKGYRNLDSIKGNIINVKRISSNHHLAKAVLDASFNKICEFTKMEN